MLLPKFQETWIRQKAVLSSPYGEHLTRGERVSGPGDPIGGSPFSFEEHDIADLDLFSLETVVTGQLQVLDKDPRNSVSANVVLDIAQADRHDPRWMTAAKRAMGTVLLESLRDSKPAYEDGVNLYVVGDTDRSPLREAVRLRRTTDPETKARAINKLEGDSLIVISTFSELDPGAIKPKRRGTAKLGVKINHPYEVALEAGLRKWETGDPEQPVVNTKKPDEVASWNQKLQAAHEARMRRGQQAGIAMVHVVCDLDYQHSGFFNPGAGDRVLSKAFMHAINAHR